MSAVVTGEPVLDLPMEALLESYALEAIGSDPAHDMAHVRRVVRNAKHLAAAEPSANMEVVVAAAWLHDIELFDKMGDQRSQASARAARTASGLLSRGNMFSAIDIDRICHAVLAHSYSARIEPETIEARIVQDADRLDALGAIGIARCFIVGGRFGASIYDEDEPIPCHRSIDDRHFILDHFQAKLFRLPDLFKTTAGRREAQRRVAFMKDYVVRLVGEVSWV